MVRFATTVIGDIMRRQGKVGKHLVRSMLPERSKTVSQWNTELRLLLEQMQSLQRQKAEKAEQQEAEIKQFFTSKVLPAFSAFKDEVKEYGREITIEEAREHVSLLVMYQEKPEFEAWIIIDPASAAGLPPFLRVDHPGRTLSGGPVDEREYFHEGQERKTMTDLSVEDILPCLAQTYARRIRYRLERMADGIEQDDW
jgi:ElaB/YqjD/DUF883 family membrane-anchored ribosome-binding protein